MTRPARQAGQVQEVRDSILDAAIAVFARKGYRAATMQEIAREAGYTAPSLYNYYPGQREIFEALVDRLDAEYIAMLGEPVPAGLGFDGKIELLVRRQVALTRKRRGAFRIYLSLQGGADGIPSERAARRHAQGFRAYMTSFAAWMDAAARGTDVGGRSGEELAFAFWGLSVGLQLRATRPGAANVPEEEEAEVKALVTMFLRGACGT